MAHQISSNQQLMGELTHDGSAAVASKRSDYQGFGKQKLREIRQANVQLKGLPYGKVGNG